MSMTNSPTRYGGVTKTFHWLVALLIVTMIPLGIIAEEMPYDTSDALARKALLFSMHKTLGIVTFFVVLARILWALSQPKPAPLHPERKLETFAAEAVHWLLYGALIVVPLSGWIHHAATTGFAPIWWPFGQSLPFVPKDDGVAELFAGLHVVFERVLVISIFLHVAGALKHHIIDRDATLRRMWFGHAEAGDPAARHSFVAPALAALAVWILAIGIGAAMGVYNDHDHDHDRDHDRDAHDHATTPAVAKLAAVESDWQVEQGTLAITVTQLGSELQGSFADWTAAIRFDESIAEGRAGEVAVTVSIPSLTLGSVTTEALGRDYFNAADHPVARFAADILAETEGWVARGTLTLKGQAVPVALPFTLDIDGGRAVMSGTLQLDRRDFGIGMADESNLKFAVDVRASLTARRAEAP